MFVDDNISVAIRSRMHEAIHAAVGSAYDFFGHPAATRRDPCLKAEKFPLEATHRILHLGYIFDTRELRITWPPDKQEVLHQMVSSWLHTKRSQKAVDIARLLGLLRHGAFLCPMGDMLSIRLQWTLNAAVKAAGASRSATSRWWKHQLVSIPADVYDDLALLRTCTDSTSMPTQGGSSIWSRPIGLVLRRQYTAQALSDASYQGLEGWCSHFSFFWRLLSPDLLATGFDLSVVNHLNHNLRTVTEHATHIDVLEFVAIIINLWFVLYFARKTQQPQGGHIVAVVADNTSALSWLRFASRNRAPAIRNLALFCHSLLTLSQTSEFLTVEAVHIPGQENIVADRCHAPR
jgi:hypothetical protein